MRSDDLRWRRRTAQLAAVAACIAAGCGPDRVTLAGDGDGAGSGGTSHADTDGAESSDGGGDDDTSGAPPVPSPNPPPGDPLCGQLEHTGALFSADEYAALLAEASAGEVDGCDSHADPFPDGGAGDTGSGTGTGGSSGSSSGSSGDSGGSRWDALPVPCATVCAASICVDEGAGDWLESVSCELGEEEDDGRRPLTCCYSIGQTGGRGHACVASRGEGSTTDPTLHWLQRLAHAEAASVYAFEQLEQELAAVGAPVSLRARVLAAAADEVRHAAAIGALVEAGGGVTPSVRTRAVPSRSVLQLAIENVVEGCVAETAAAMVAVFQGRHAEDATLRAIFTDIGRDEVRHAGLAWDLHDWLVTRLTPRERARVRSAAADAMRGVLSGASELEPTELRRLGLPDRRHCAEIHRVLSTGPWRELAATA